MQDYMISYPQARSPRSPLAALTGVMEQVLPRGGSSHPDWAIVSDHVTTRVRALLGPSSTWHATPEDCWKRFNTVRKKKALTGNPASHQAQKVQIARFKDIYAIMNEKEVSVQAIAKQVLRSLLGRHPCRATGGNAPAKGSCGHLLLRLRLLFPVAWKNSSTVSRAETLQ